MKRESRSAYDEVAALLQQWRDAIDAVPVAVSLEVAALRAREKVQQRAHEAAFPTVAHAICQIADTAARPTAEPTILDFIARHPDDVL